MTATDTKRSLVDELASARPRRTAAVDRATRETTIRARLDLDGPPRAVVRTGLGFLDHMLTTLALHARVNLELTAVGDLQVDDHHNVEDCAIVLATLLRDALGARTSIARYGWTLIPMDEALGRCAVDLVARPAAEIDLGFRGQRLGTVATENITHFFRTLALTAPFTLHLDIVRGDNDHHRAEAAFKAFAIALRDAVRLDAIETPSVKGSMT